MRYPFRLAGKCCVKHKTFAHNSDDSNNNITVDDDDDDEKIIRTLCVRGMKDYFSRLILLLLPFSFPPRQQDVSDIRPVPDQQECYQSDDEEVPSLLVIEILQRESSVENNDQAGEYFFKDLVENNGVVVGDAPKFQSIPIVRRRQQQQQSTSNNNNNNTLLNTPGIYVCGGIGYQEVPMGRDVEDVAGNSRRPVQETRQKVRIDLVLFRLQQQGTDLLITLTTPVQSKNGIGTDESTTSSLNPILNQVITTLTIHDWGLFG
jgi:hypothetical protein